MEKITYKKAGVDIDEGDRFVSLIAPMAKKTFGRGVMMDIGSFGALFKLDLKKYKEPVLVSGTDGVGTKLKIAFMMDKHDTVGIDLVAMCVNDILTLGADPLFFLDYFATGKLKADKAKDVVKGIAEGCKQADCALIGGETAEMPGFYEAGEYDLAGFAVGAVDRKKIINGSAITEGDAIIGLSSSGIHSNGYSLARKVLIEKAGFKLNKKISELGCTLGEELLKPTTIYVKAFRSLVSKNIKVKGMAHITGGGVPGNLPRIFGKGISAVLKDGSWPVPSVFELIRRLGNVPEADMRRTFNCGIGFVFIVNNTDVGKTIKCLKKVGYDAYNIGTIHRGVRKQISYV